MSQKSEIEELLPHRPPFLFVDKLLDGLKKSVRRYHFKEDEFLQKDTSTQ